MEEVKNECHQNHSHCGTCSCCDCGKNKTCGTCFCGCGGGTKRRIIRLILAIIIVCLLVCLGIKIGEFKAFCNSGFYGSGLYQTSGFGPGMMR